VYNLKIRELTKQRDMQALVKILLKVPGLNPDQVSKGLKIPPLNVFSAEKEEEAQKLKSLLEKFGAVCAIENTEALAKENRKKTAAHSAEFLKRRRRFRIRRFVLKFWLAIFSVLGIFIFITFYDFSGESKPSQSQSSQGRPIQSKQVLPSQTAKQVAQAAKMLDDALATVIKSQNAATVAKTNSELRKEIVKNPYNADAWKALAENLEKQGDTASAQQAKESHEKSVKVQMVLASLAKAFGNKVRVEILEDAIYYRTSYDFTDSEFHAEAKKLMDSLTFKFPDKNLIIENYTSDNRVQTVQLKPK
jgi:enamine deaminase RidA (YjgF/YER057c/UK114 family)